MIDDCVFITGAHRSGTTLLEKLLNQQPEVAVLSQPFPLLFVESKRSFFRTIGLDDVRYPLGHLFQEDRYTQEQFAEFLGDWRVPSADLQQVFENMRTYSGQYTRFSSEEIASACVASRDAPDFASLVQALLRVLQRKAGASWFASKEAICEEFLPFLLNRGFRCLLIIRDPRDVIASLNHGRGVEFTGPVKPTLFNIRNWRKSVAHALALEGRSRFRWCRYEDLVRHPIRETVRLVDSVDLPAYPLEPAAKLRELDGTVWQGNSSFGSLSGISDASIGVSGRVLKPQTRRLIEAACLPELRLLGYETTLTHNQAVETLGEMREEYESNRNGLEGDAPNATNADREVGRLARVIENTDAESRHWFLFETAHTRLRQGYGSE